MKRRLVYQQWPETRQVWCVQIQLQEAVYCAYTRTHTGRQLAVAWTVVYGYRLRKPQWWNNITLFIIMGVQRDRRFGFQRRSIAVREFSIRNRNGSKTPLLKSFPRILLEYLADEFDSWMSRVYEYSHLTSIHGADFCHLNFSLFVVTWYF